MGINLDKSVKEVKIVLEKIGFTEKVQVALVLDISGSMSGLYRQGAVQELVERALAIGINMDADQEIDVYLFGARAHHAAPAYRTNIEGFVKKEILNKFDLEGSTLYTPVMKMVAKSFGHMDTSVATPKVGFMSKLFGKSEPVVKEAPLPTVVFFVTDGDNFDQRETEAFIRHISDRPIFWQFIGIGGSSFSFLESLDELSGRTIDNANFFDAGDISSISDNILYSRILTELPSWHKEAKQKGIIK